MTSAGVAFCADPHPEFHRLREHAPVHRRDGSEGRTQWYLTRYDDVRRALADPALVRAAGPAPAGDPLATLRCTVLNLDPPAHTRLRRLLTPALTARRVGAMRPRIQEIVDGLVDGMVAAPAPADVLADLARPLQAIVAAELVGLPIGDVALFRSWSDAIADAADPARVRTVGCEFLDYAEPAIGRLRTRPDGSLLSALVCAEGTALSHEELVSSLFQLLLAGDETGANLIGNGVLELLRHPDQLRLLRERPELVGSAVEELARFNGPVGHTRHLHAVTDLGFRGASPDEAVVVRRGDVVVPVLLAANRDPAVFRDPDRLDIRRHPNRHVGFGHGVHLCLGAFLGRVLARAAIGTLVRRAPGLVLAVGPDELEWTPHLFVHGLRRLPVTALPVTVSTA